MFVLIDDRSEPSKSRYLGTVLSVHKTLPAAVNRYVGEDQPFYIFEIPGRVSKGDRVLRSRSGARFEAEAVARAKKLIEQKAEQTFRGAAEKPPRPKERKSKSQSLETPATRNQPKRGATKKSAAKRGRPPKRASEKQSAHIGIAVTPQERREMQAAAREQQKTLSEYLRWLHANHRALRS